MTRQEAVDALRETWEKYADLDHPSLTTEEKREVDNLLDDVERLIKG